MVTRCKQIQDWVETESLGPGGRLGQEHRAALQGLRLVEPTWLVLFRLVTIFVKIVIFVMRRS